MRVLAPLRFRAGGKKRFFRTFRHQISNWHASCFLIGIGCRADPKARRPGKPA